MERITMKVGAAITILCGGTILSTAESAEISRIWLSFQRPQPTHLTVNWETEQRGPSEVRFGNTPELGGTVSSDAEVMRHHVEVPVPRTDTTYYYQVQSGKQTSAVHTFKGMPTRELRVAVLGNWASGGADLSALIRDDLHVLMTAGDNVPSLHQAGREGARAFSALIDSQPELFRRTPFMPALGNHDREIRSRGATPPPSPAYDVEATAYREFFALPEPEWRWSLSFPEFNARFVALDLNHISDHGTTWQTCHAWDAGSEQIAWYRSQMQPTVTGHVVTIYNERNSAMRREVAGEWGGLFQRGRMAITGFGHFAERAVVDGFPYYNTSVKGDGDRYPDPKGVFFASEHNYLLITFTRGSAMRVELKNLQGDVLDQQSYPARE